MSAEYLHKMFNLEGKTAVVTGGAGVLCGAFCEGLAQAGAHVVVADLTEEMCMGRVEQLEKLGAKVSHCRVNVTSRESIEGMLAAAIEQTGRADILVNGAGVNAGTSFLEATDEAWDRVMAINLRGIFQSCQVFGRHMIGAGGGSIVNVGSVTSHLPLSRVFAYSASKAAVLNLTRNIAQEPDFATNNVRVNAICPGFFPAEQNRKLLDDERVDNIMRNTPLKRYGEAEELIGALLLLTAPVAGSFITGTHINVDGGFTAAWF